MTEQIRESRLTHKETHFVDSNGEMSLVEIGSEKKTMLGVLGVTKCAEYLAGASLE